MKPLLLLAFIASVFTGCSINENVRVEDGETHRGGLTSVNGSLIVGRDCRVGAGAHTVNGSIKVGRGSQVRDLMTVNGRIQVGADVTVDGDIESVNGAVRAGAGAEIDGRLKVVNGNVELDGTRVRHRIETVNGDIVLTGGSRVAEIVIEKVSRPSGSVGLTIRITDGSVVEGDIICHDKRRHVRVYLSEGGKVLGQVRNAQIFEGS